MLETKYPEPKFLLDPLIRDKTVTQISGDYGSGKTHIGLKTAIDISQDLVFYLEKAMSVDLSLTVTHGIDTQEKLNQYFT